MNVAGGPVVFVHHWYPLKFAFLQDLESGQQGVVQVDVGGLLHDVASGVGIVRQPGEILYGLQVTQFSEIGFREDVIKEGLRKGRHVD